MTKHLGLEWAPVNIPVSRRLQTTAVFTCIFFLLSPIFWISLYLYLLISTRFWWLMLIYLIWMFYDENTPKSGGRPLQWARDLAIWKHYAAYFPATVEKTADMPTDRSYILGCHPHGIAGLGFFVTFGTNGTDLKKLFPQIKFYLCTLSMNFWMPFRRELLNLLGVIDVSKESIKHVVTKGTGKACVIVIGGAREALEAGPGRVTIVLKERKGFVKLAMRNGADLVPVFSFGENEIFEQVKAPPGSTLREIQLKARDYLPFSLPLFYGRGIFNYTMGFMPHRRPIVTIIGKPIRIEMQASPTQEQVSELHQRYMDELSGLFEDNKKRFGIADDVHLEYI